jgi:Holliday junction resolvase
MGEYSIQNSIMKYLRRQPGIYSIKTHGASLMGQAGLPDIIGCRNGKFFGIEVKKPGEEPTPIQLFQLRQIRKAGGNTLIAVSLEDVVTFIEGLDS